MHEDRSFRAMLQRSLDLLREESPLHYVGVFRQLEGLELDIEVDEERFVLYANRGTLVIGEDIGQHAASSGQIAKLKTTRKSLKSLADGAVHILHAIRTFDLEVSATSTSLRRLDNALQIYLNGTLRSQDHLPLHNKFTTGA